MQYFSYAWSQFIHRKGHHLIWQVWTTLDTFHSIVAGGFCLFLSSLIVGQGLTKIIMLSPYQHDAFSEVLSHRYSVMTLDVSRAINHIRRARYIRTAFSPLSHVSAFLFKIKIISYTRRIKTFEGKLLPCWTLQPCTNWSDRKPSVSLCPRRWCASIYADHCDCLVPSRHDSLQLKQKSGNSRVTSLKADLTRCQKHGIHSPPSGIIWLPGSRRVKPGNNAWPERLKTLHALSMKLTLQLWVLAEARSSTS